MYLSFKMMLIDVFQKIGGSLYIEYSQHLMVMQVHSLCLMWKKCPYIPASVLNVSLHSFTAALKEAKNICFLYVGPVCPAVSSSG